MTDRQYECILAIAEEGTISSAAKKLYISQSSLSQMLSHVEAELGMPLFIRGTSGMNLTHAGKLYADAARNILRITQGLKKQIEGINNIRSGKITIGIAMRRSWLLMPFILPTYMKEFPDVEIVFVETDQDELDKLVLQGNIDIAFTTKIYQSKDIHYEHIYNEYLLLALPKELGMSCGFKDNLTARDFKKLRETPFILTREGHAIREMINNIFYDYSFSPQILLESHSMDVCFQMAAAGLGLTIIPDTLYKIHFSKHKVFCYKIAEKYHRKVSMMHHKDFVLPFIMREFIRISKEAVISAIVKPE